MLRITLILCCLLLSMGAMAQPVPRPRPTPAPPPPTPPPPAPTPVPAPTPAPASPSVRLSSVSPVILPKIDDLIAYQEVNSISGSPVEISEKVKKWLASYYPDPSAVIQSASPEKILGKAIFPIRVDDGGHTFPEKIHYSFEINFKPGKYRFTLRYFYFENAQLHDPAEKVYTFYLDHYHAHAAMVDANILNHQRFVQLKEQVRLWISSLKTRMSDSGNSDW